MDKRRVVLGKSAAEEHSVDPDGQVLNFHELDQETICRVEQRQRSFVFRLVLIQLALHLWVR